MNVLANLVVFLGLDSAKFTQGLDQATEKTRQFNREQARLAKEGEANFKKFTAAAFNVVTAIAAIAAVTFRHADNIKDLANAYDSSVESVLALNQAFIVSGGNSETAAKLLGKLTQSAESAREGNVKLRQSFAEIGISAAEVQNLNPDELLLRVAESLKHIEDPTVRNAKAFELLGKAAKGIDWKSIADEYDRIADPELAKSVEDAAKAWDNIQKALKNIFEAVVKLLEPLALVINYLSDLPKKLRELRAQGGTTLMPDGMGGFVEVENAPDEKYAEERKKRIEDAKKARDQRAKEVAAKGGYKIQDAEQLAAAAAKQAAQIAMQQFEIEKSRLDLLSRRHLLTETEFELEREALDTADKIAKLELKRAEVSRQITKENAGSKKLEIDNINQQIEYERELSGIRVQGIQDEEMRQRDFGYGWSQAFKRLFEDNEKLANQAARVFQTLESGFDQVLDKITGKSKRSFKDIAASIIQDLIKIQIKASAISLLKASGINFGALGSLFGGGGGSSSTDFLNVGSSSGGFGLRAAGGPVNAGSPYMVGERGPEMFVPRGSGEIIPNNALSTTTNVTYNINAIDSKSFEQRLAQNPKLLYGITQEGQRRSGVGSYS